MEIEIGPIPKYGNVKRHAAWARIGIDTSLRVDEDTLQDYKAHLQDCEKNPTVGFLARKKYITGKPMNYTAGANRNLSYIRRQPEIISLENSIKNKIQTLYPRTSALRQYIIDNDRVVLDKTKQIRKYTIFNKLKIMLKKLV